MGCGGAAQKIYNHHTNCCHSKEFGEFNEITTTTTSSDRCYVGVDSGATGHNGVYSVVCLHSAI